MRLVGFIIRIYHDTRSPERQKLHNKCVEAHTDPHTQPDGSWSTYCCYMFRTVPLSIIRCFFHCTHSQSVSVVDCTVKNSWWWTEKLSETCRVYSKNKFEKLVHLVGFIIRIYHDTRSPGCQILFVRPSVRPHGTRLPLEGFSWNLIFYKFFENLSTKFKFH